MTGRMEGWGAIVTAGEVGIGAAIVRRLVAEGAFVCATGLRAESLEAMAAELPADRIITSPGDIREAADNARAVDAIIALAGRLDVLVNNAAVGTDSLGTDVGTSLGIPGSISETSVAQWRATLDVNLTGTFLMTRAGLAPMLEAGRGCVINIASMAGLRAGPDAAAYSTSKAGVVMLSRQAAIDYGPRGIRVNAICPGWVRTPSSEAEVAQLSAATGRSDEELFVEIARDNPLRRVADPAEVAAVVAFLASDDASYINGAALVVDGGAANLEAGTMAFFAAMAGTTQA